MARFTLGRLVMAASVAGSAVAAAVPSALAAPATRTVRPGQSIQAAIDAAAPGALVRISAGHVSRTDRDPQERYPN